MGRCVCSVITFLTAGHSGLGQVFSTQELVPGNGAAYTSSEFQTSVTQNAFKYVRRTPIIQLSEQFKQSNKP